MIKLQACTYIRRESTTMICIKVFGVPTETEATAVKIWLDNVAGNFLNRSRVKIIIIVIPTPLTVTSLCGEQVIEIFYTRPHQQRIRSGLVPHLLSDLNTIRPPIKAHWEPYFVLMSGEAITLQNIHA